MAYRIRFLILLWSAHVLSSPARAGDETFEALRDRHTRALTSASAPADVRIKALEWLAKNARSLDNAQATAAVEKCLRHPDARVRAAAVKPRAGLAIATEAACPPSIIEAMLDPDPGVRENAINWSGAYPPGRLSQEAAPVLLRCVKCEDYNVRSLAVLLLAQLPKKEKTIIQAVKELTGDKHRLVRNDAHSALYRITGRLDDIVPYCLLFRAERHDALRIRTERLWGNEQAQSNLIAIGIAVRLHQLAEERSDDFAAHLVGLLANDDAALRRATSMYFADYFRGQALPVAVRPVASPFPFLIGEKPPPPPDKETLRKDAPGAGRKEVPDWMLLDPFAPQDPETQRRVLETSAKKQAAFRQRLYALGLQKRLQPLRDSDPEALVRGAAAQALLQIAAMQEKEAAPR